MKNYTEIIHDSKTMRGYHHKNNHKKLVLMLHGFTGSKTENKLLFRKLSERLEEVGFDSLRMDYFGHGESDGQFRDMTLDTLNDQVQVLQDYASSLGYEKMYLLGFSMGGMLSLLNLDSRFEKTVLISPAVKMPEGTKTLFENTNLKNGNADIGGLELSREFYDTLIDIDVSINKDNYLNPVLFITGENDTTVLVEDVKEVYSKFSNATLKVIANGNHVYSSLQLREVLFKNIIEFLK